MSKAITESKWRNFVPVAPTLMFDVYRGDSGNLSLKKHLLQGAGDFVTQRPDTDILDNVGSQRGWLCKYFNISRPSRGQLKNNLRSDGFQYDANPLYVGSDCFSYILNMGTQNSVPGMIKLNIKDYMSGRIVIEENKAQRTSGSRYYRFIVQWYVPPEFGKFDNVLATWYITKPQRYEKDGKVFVRMVKEEISRTAIKSVRYYSGGGFAYNPANHIIPSNGFMEFKWPDPKLAQAIDERTNLPFVQALGAFKISVDLSFRNWEAQQMTGRRRYRSSYRYYWSSYWRWQTFTWYRTYWTDIYDISFDIVQLYGKNWWRSGYPIDVGAPGFVPNLPGTYVPDLIIEPEVLEDAEPLDPQPWYEDYGLRNRLSAGSGHSLLLQTDSKATAWGSNLMGQTRVPKSVSFLRVVAANLYSMGIDTGRKLHVWGYDSQQFVTKSPAGMANCKTMDAGEAHGMLLLETGEVVGWISDNPSEDIVPDQLANMPTFVPPSGEEPAPQVMDLDCGAYHTVALMSDGTVAVWGTYAGDEQYAVPEGTNFVQVSAGGDQTMALTDEGRIVSWAGNSASAPAGVDWRSVICGGTFTIALHKAGHIFVWGSDTHKQVSNAPTGENWSYTNFLEVVAGHDHGFAIRADGTIVAWGANARGESTVDKAFSILEEPEVILEEPDPPYEQPAAECMPIPHWNDSNAQPWYHDYGLRDRIGCGVAHTSYLRPGDNTAAGLGMSLYGQLDAPSGVAFKKLTAQHAQTLGIDVDGVLHVWGFNEGNYVTNAPTGTGNCKTVSSGRANGVLLLHTGETITWAIDASPNNTSAQRATEGLPVFDPNAPEDAPKIVDVACGQYHTIGLMSDGSIISGGFYTIPEDRKDTSSIMPAPEESNFVQIAAGGAQSMAITDEGRIVSWGLDGGEGVPEGTGWRSIACGQTYAVALHKHGYVVVWEMDGRTTKISTDAPTEVAVADLVCRPYFIEVISGEDFALAIAADGRVFGWGENFFGQLNFGSTYSVLPPLV